MKSIALILLIFSIAWGNPYMLVKEQSPENWKQEVKTIDRIVTELIDLRNKELSKAEWAQNQGDRLQFQSHNLIDARYYWNKADMSREIAARYQQEIEKLEARKKEVLEQQKIPYTPPNFSNSKA